MRVPLPAARMTAAIALLMRAAMPANCCGFQSGPSQSATAPLGPQVTREHRGRHAHPVRAAIEGLLKQEIARAAPIVARRPAAAIPAAAGSVPVPAGGPTAAQHT